ncbi:MAG: hypothetical protein L0211_09695 [Planctomycetaceae bacterium]|nr:hypothetical protein [Planctomycetaceae bacterium]
MNPTREHLLGYLLGALEPAEQAEVERELARDMRLRDELERLEDCVGRIGLLDEPEHYSPPEGLATRACEYVACESQELVRPAQRPREVAAFSSVADPAEVAGSRRLTWVDLLTAAAVLIAGFALFFPALSLSRFQAQVATCQNHLRQTGLALQQHAVLDELHRFPQIATVGNRSRAGIYAPTLVNNQLVLDPRSFVCPTGYYGTHLNELQIPSWEQLDAAQGAMLAQLYEAMGGDYGFNMGYQQDGQLVAPRDERRPNYVLLADKPSDRRPGRTTANHGGRGQNLLCEDGRVCWCPTVPTAEVTDDPFHNRQGKVLAGLDRHDAVIGASPDSPLPIKLISE